MYGSSYVLGALAVVAVFAFMVSLALGKPVIKWLYGIKFGQNINEDAPESHQKKQGTPSSGGVLMVLAVTAGLAVYEAGAAMHPVPGFALLDPRLIAVYLVFVAHAGLGFLDDFLKAKRGKSLGLKAREKLALQVVVAGAFGVWLALAFPDLARTSVAYWHHAQVHLGFVYYVFAALLMIGLSNATNLTDGLDGLATGLSITTAAALAVVLLFVVHGADVQRYDSFDSLQTDIANNAGASASFCAALAGACLGFLWFNAHPAKVFMGDTGSLALGAAFAALAVINKIELPLLVIMLVFVAEIASVIIQVGVFKMTGGKPNGRRVFKMAPLHHHFELCGLPETQVVARFCIAGVVAAVCGIAYVGVLQQ